MQHGWCFPDADEFMAGELTPDGRYQDSHLEAALALVTDFSCAIDGGAHVGTWTRPMSQRFARVIAVEPSPDTFEALSANVTAFGCTNVELHQAALGSEPGFVSLAPLDPRAEALRNTGARYVHESPGATIQRLRIDDWKLDTCGFIKLDVEGSEPLALEGALLTLRRCRPIVLFENKKFWRRFGLADDAPQQILRGAGYRLRCVARMDAIWGPEKAKR
jgi:FkbM family methyltransferase